MHQQQKINSFLKRAVLQFLFSLAFACIFFACGPEKPTEKPIVITRQKMDSMMAEAEKAYNKMEEDRIQNYIATHHAMQKNNNGYWYWISKENPKGKKIEDLSLVRYSRIISLCNGNECYRDTNIVKVGNGNEIRGMHDAFLILKEGEKATFIFPSYIAHGLLGDNYKIPPKSELVYTVEILEVK